MRRQRQPVSLTKTAALLFFIGLLIADGIVAFFLIRQRLDSYFPPKPALYLPVIHNNPPVGEPQALPTSSSPARTPTETARPTEKKYIVKSGDTLFQIAQDQSVTVEDLVIANHLDDKNVIKVGQELIIPSSSATSSPSSTPATPAPSSSQTPYP